MIVVMIKGFANDDTERLFHGRGPKKLPNDIWKRGARKLLLINAADDVQDLRVPPGNRLEKLKGYCAGQFSIRINSQWRICFDWRDGHAFNVEITDYH
jgi:proteic killer suppression protein